MADAQLQLLAEQLENARTSRVPCKPVTADAALDKAQAYAIQQINVERRLASGVRLVGHKVGLTSEAVQSWLEVDEPDFGCLLSDMETRDDGVVDTASLLQPRAEGELAFVLDHDLDGPVSLAQVVRATAFVLPAIEIVDSRIADWKITYADTVADNASSGRFVLGARPVRLEDLDPRLCGMKLVKNGRVVSTGAGAACLGNPVNAVRWLANTLGEHGQTLAAGSVILSGAMGPVTEVEPGDSVELSISGAGSCRARFA